LETTAARALKSLDLAPIRFEQGVGSALFTAQGVNYRLLLRAHGAEFGLRDDSGAVRNVSFTLPGANPDPAVEGQDRMALTTNHFEGSDRSRWRKNVPNYRRVRLTDVYPGIDMVYYGSGGRLEYDFVVKPNADPGVIRLRFGGVDDIAISEEKDLVLSAGGASLVQQKPIVYQGAERVDGEYRIARDGDVVFALGDYDRTQPLVIDPVLVYTGFLGALAGDMPVAAAVDAGGFFYVAGYTTSTAFPVTDRAAQNAAQGERDIFVAKIDPNVPPDVSIVYATYFGGSGMDTPRAVAVDAAGFIYVTGSTSSTNFIAGNGYQTAMVGDSDGFVTKLDPGFGGSEGVSYSSYLGGSGDESAHDLFVDGHGRIYVAGATSSTDFPLLGASAQSGSGGGTDAFVAVFDPARDRTASLVYTSYLGGEGMDTGKGIVADAEGVIYVAGSTTSGSFPLAGAAVQLENKGRGDVFAAKLNPALGSGAGLVYSTLLGGGDLDEPRKIVLDGSGRAVVTGYTLSGDYPTTPNARQNSNGGSADVFLSRLDFSMPAAEVLNYSTYLGGANADVLYDTKVDVQGSVYLTGYTMSDDFPVAGQALQSSRVAVADAFLAKFDFSQEAGKELA
jgi:Beta-propeller repeat